ncbi:MAG TPA: ATP-dependent DNA ligase [Candidatus Limnocylindria bacterium]|nr:ATP-dependent DNA ligase [Candidatus Limnocylindria bacterium]
MPQATPPPRPMLAALEAAPLVSDRFAYEPKYDGIRTLAVLERSTGAATVRLWSRLGNDKTAQFPDLVRPLGDVARRLRSGVVLDGEIVALDADGEPAGFQRLQGRIHLTGERAVAAHAGHQPVALIVFDLLREGAQNLMDLPLIERRARLERLLAGTTGGAVRLSEFVRGDGRELYRRAAERGWEGLVAKRLDSRYAAGRRSHEWRKIKILQRQDCVVGGWTEPRGSRSHFGALLLGVREHGAPRVRRPHGHRLHRCRAGPPRPPPRPARHPHLSLPRPPPRQRAPALGGPRPCGGNRLHRMDRRPQAPPPKVPRHPGRRSGVGRPA